MPLLLRCRPIRAACLSPGEVCSWRGLGALSDGGDRGREPAGVHVVVIGENEKARSFAQNINTAVEAGHFVMSTASQRSAPVGH
jgi:hypothetical protein